MIILSEKKLRSVVRSEFERFMEVPRASPDVLSIKAETGAEIIMPNYVRERFDNKEVNSFADII